MLSLFKSLYMKLKSTYPNIYIVMISVLVTVWFQGMIRIIRKLFPDKGMKNSLMLMIVPALILYFGDGRLDEIYNFENLSLRVTAMNNTSGDGSTPPRPKPISIE